MIKTEVFRIRLEPDSKRDLKQIAKQNGKSGSSIVRELIAIAKQQPHILSTQANDG